MPFQLKCRSQFLTELEATPEEVEELLATTNTFLIRKFYRAIALFPADHN